MPEISARTIFEAVHGAGCLLLTIVAAKTPAAMIITLITTKNKALTISALRLPIS